MNSVKWFAMKEYGEKMSFLIGPIILKPHPKRKGKFEIRAGGRSTDGGIRSGNRKFGE